MEKQFQREKLNYKFINAIDTSNDLVKNHSEYVNNDDYPISTLSQVAICFSQKKCVDYMIEKNLDYVIIFEDDVHIMDNFSVLIKDLENKLTKDEPLIIRFTGYNHKMFFSKIETIPSKKINNLHTCAYLINRKWAEIFNNNFFPLKLQVDVFTRVLTNNNSDIIDLTTTPMMCWDLSSGYFERFYTEEDKIFMQNIVRLSN